MSRPASSAVVAAAREQGLLVNAVSPSRLRLVTHLDFPFSAVGDALDRFRKALAV